MKWIMVILTLGFNVNLYTQIYDDFSDGDLTINPKWSGMPYAFKDSNKVLQSNYLVSNSTFYLSVPIWMDSLMHFYLDARLAFNTSSVNYLDFVVCSDTSDLLNIRNGWIIRCGGTTDNLSLIKIIEGKEVKTIDGDVNCFNHAINEFSLTLDIRLDSMVLTFMDNNANFQYYHSVWSDSITNAYAGIRIKQSTSSFFKKHFIKKIYIGSPIKDSMPLQIDSVSYLGNQWIQLHLSEVINRKDSLDWRFFLDGWTSCLFDSLQLTQNDQSVKLHFPCLLPNQWYELYVMGLTDIAGNKSDTQELRFFTLVTEPPMYLDLVINEMMVDPEPSQGLPEKEYVELYNRSGKFVDLEGLQICDLMDCQPILPMALFPDSFLVCMLVPSLNNSEDVISIKDKKGQIIHQVHYTDKWYQDETKSKGGFSLELMDPHSLCKGSMNWRASVSLSGGTPGYGNSVYKPFPPDTTAPNVLKFEFIFPDRINLYFSEPYDSIVSSEWPCLINGFPTEAIIRHQDGLHGYLSLRLIRTFSLDSEYLVSIKGVKDCDQNQRNWMSFKSRVAASPSRYELIFNEVLFNPKSGADDFIELFNRSSHAINMNLTYLLDPANGNIYPLSDSFKMLPANCFALICSDTLAVCNDYNCGVENYVKLQLKAMPSMPDDGVNLQLINQNWELIDSLVCSEDWHFQLIKDRNGVSLERINPNLLDLNSVNWTSASSLSGYGTPAKVNSQFLNLNANNDYFNVSSATISPDNDGFEDRIFIQYQMPSADYLCTVNLYNENGLLVNALYNNYSVGTSGVLVFDGLSDTGVPLSEGVYLLHINGHSPNKPMIIKYFTLYLVK